jgi:hypothetical protein
MESKNEQNVLINSEQYERIIKDGTGYEPSVSVKRSYLPIRKKNRLLGGVNYPGLFDYDPALDSLWFWFTVALEVATLIITSWILKERFSSTSVLLVSVIGVFFLDFTLAYFHHRSKTDENLIENKKRLFLSEMRAAKFSSYADYAAHLKQNYKDNLARKIVKPLSVFAILTICFIKGVTFLASVLSSDWFYSAIQDSKMPLVIIAVVVISYIWIAYNHLTFTGYFLAACSHKKQYRSEEAKYRRGVGEIDNSNKREYKNEKIDVKMLSREILRDQTNPCFNIFFKQTPEEIESSLRKGLFEINEKNHGILKNDNNEYVIYRYGLLTDDDLQKLVDKQKTTLAQLVVAIYGHKLQMQSGYFDADQSQQSI